MRTWGRSKMGHGFTGEPGAGSRGRSRASRRALRGALTVLTLAVLVGCSSSLADIPTSSDPQTAAPTFNLEPGTYPSDLEIDLVAEDPNATIYYTIADGGSAPEPDPADSATQTYTGTPIPVAGDGTVKTISAVAGSDSGNTSDVATATFTIEWPELTLAGSGNGTVAFAAGGGTGPRPVEAGSTVEITATPESGFQFGGWSVTSGDAQSVEFTDATAATTEVTLGAEDATVTASFVDEAAPNAPNVSGPSLTDDPRPTWSWTSGGGGNGTFRYKINDSDMTTGATTTSATAYMPANDLEDGQQTLYVQERDDAGNWSAAGSATVTIDTTPPGSVGSLSASAGFGEATLTWSDPSDGDLDHIEITWSPTDGESQPRTVGPGTETATVTGLVNGTDYTFTVTAVDALGNASVAATIDGTPDGTAPGEVSSLTASAEDGQVSLSWTDPSDGDLDQIQITWTPQHGGTQPLEVAPGTEAATVSGLDNAETYEFTVVSIDEVGNSSQGETITESPNSPPVAVISSPAPYTEVVNFGYADFDGSTSTDADGEIVSYEWDFGTGTETGPTVSRGFFPEGVHDVYLTVTDDEGATGTDQVTIISTLVH